MTGVIAPNNVVQFRAVPYATLPGRFQHSALLEDLSSTNRDFTKPGFACPQTWAPDAFVGGLLPGEPIPEADEFKSLIIQVNVPLEVLRSYSSGTPSSKIPVMLYLHGGGFVLGKIDGAHNTAFMVEQSIADKTPVIGASFQYRLGALGFLKTPQGDTNFGLYDQRNALLWVQKFIGGFGGDAARTTVFGESAGSMSICAHMLAAPPPSGPLFQRAILMSGVVGPMTAPVPFEEADELFDLLLKTLGIQETGQAGLDKAREVDVQAIVNATAHLSGVGQIFFPTHDEAWFGKTPVAWDRGLELLEQCEWVNDIVLGSTGFEGQSSFGIAAGVQPNHFIKALEEKIGKENANIVFEAYNIVPDMDPILFLTPAMRWLGDTLFDAPNHNLARLASRNPAKKLYRYVFDVRNPFPGHGLYQQAHHWVDVYFVFRSFLFRYPTQRLKNISNRHAQLWIEFANGKEPWTQYKYNGNTDEVIMVADERDEWSEKTVKAYEAVAEVRFERLEALTDSWKDERGKRFLPFRIEPLSSKKLT
ncbi:alpha/beta-hydrolase [Aaosphaeria arxii CBS 175.79]|uniref:Alpha/beta-hydrolase n=1 Tax=Aaosphaeria arxii CBS 175.79 TaxID=1450172 RepID=A0A6A5XTV9_9PLEO|nr:alpha/beta-hydrolase [Aaosphaeria arxii CBS 175.79]KAF2016349.1 alpha/beta-hydrolase [Aaosphaeria arxii CBS 175.79]